MLHHGIFQHHAASPKLQRLQDLPLVHQRSEEHTSELPSLTNLVCRLLLEKKNRPTPLCPAVLPASRRREAARGSPPRPRPAVVRLPSVPGNEQLARGATLLFFF